MWRDEHLVLDMLIYARRARDLTAGVTWGRFSTDELLQFATQRVLQNVGEAASKVSQEYRQAHPEIPWPKIVGLRHRLVHDYTRVNITKVWDIVRQDVEPLIAALEPLVPPPPADSPQQDNA
jgi:uncharacterized protein with HEPN domain